MTYNVHHCNPPDRADVIDVDAIAAVIREEGADVIAVQEIDVNAGRSGKIDQAALLSEKAGYPHFYFASAMDFDGGKYGVLILSKHPLTDTVAHVLPRSESDRGEPRLLAVATVTLPDGSAYQFGCTHMEAYNAESRVLQAAEIGRIAGSTKLRFIVAGDFNAEEDSEVIQLIDEHFTRTCNNCPDTFDEEGHQGTLDYVVFHPKEAFVVVSHNVIQNKTASDHMPVVAELSVK